MFFPLESKQNKQVPGTKGWETLFVSDMNNKPTQFEGAVRVLRDDSNDLPRNVTGLIIH